MSRKNDMKLGFESENKCKIYIEDITGSLNKTDMFDVFDYYNDEYLVELKTRRNEYNKYPTTMIGLNKIIEARKELKKCIFCFKFTDGLYYHIFDKNIDYEIKKGGRSDRGCFEIKDYVYININQLIKII